MARGSMAPNMIRFLADTKRSQLAVRRGIDRRFRTLSIELGRVGYAEQPLRAATRCTTNRKLRSRSRWQDGGNRMTQRRKSEGGGRKVPPERRVAA